MLYDELNICSRRNSVVSLVLPKQIQLLKADMEAEQRSDKSTVLSDGVKAVGSEATTGLIICMMRVLNLYKDIYGLISTEDKETETYMHQYGEVFSATDQGRIAYIHSDLISGIFRDRSHAYIGMPHLLKKRLSSLKLEDIELGSNLLDENGNSKKKGVYLPLGPVWRMSVKLRKRAKQMIKAGSDKVEKTDVMHTGMHQIFQLIIKHLEPLMEDAKSVRSCKHSISWYHEYRILCKSGNDEQATISDAMSKARSLMSGPLIGQVLSGSGLGDVDEGHIQSVLSRLFSGVDNDNSAMEGIFSQISSGEFDPSSISSFVSNLTKELDDEDAKELEDEDAKELEDEESDLNEYDEVVTYEDVD